MKSDFDSTLMHGRDYSGQNLAGCVATEKFNGHRERWQEGALITRYGNRLEAPAWFTAGFPDVRIDGELFVSRAGGHNAVTKALNRGDWQALSFIAFDLPDATGGYYERHRVLQGLSFPGHVRACGATVLPSSAAAVQMLRGVMARGGEGLMLHHPLAEYRPGRVKTLLKMFPRNAHLAEFSDLVKFCRVHA
jgi:DNA ligase-1